MKRLKKYLSLLLVACMICSNISPAFAEEIKEEEFAIEQQEYENEIVEKVGSEIAEEVGNEVPEEIAAASENDAAYEGKGMTLSGEISGDLTVPEDIDSLVLAGASGKNARIIVKGETEIVLEEGKTNELDIIEADKTIIFSGSGNLKLSFGIVGRADIIFNHTGQIDVSDGTVFSLKGNIVFNGGTVNVHASETAAAAVMAVCGEVIQNEGLLSAEGGMTENEEGQIRTIIDSSDVNLGGTVSDFNIEAGSGAVYLDDTGKSLENTEQIENDLSGAVHSDASDDTQITKDEFGEVIRGKFSFYMGRPITTDFIYRDSDFATPSNIYNQKLALMSLDFAATGFANPVGGVSETPRYLRELLGKTGFSDVYVNEAYITQPEANTIGVCIAHRKIGTQSVVAVVLRGGGYGREWSGNLNVGQDAEHAGWAIARNTMIGELMKYMNEHADVISDNTKFWIIGYSRSAAAANLGVNFMDCAIDINNGRATIESVVPKSERSDEEKQLLGRLSELFKGKNIGYKDIYGYTFGTPRGAAGDNGDATGYPNHTDPDTNNIWSLTNQEDLVQYVVPTYGLAFYRYGVSADPRFMSIPEGYSSKNIENQGKDVEGLMLKQLKAIDPEMYEKLKDAPEFELRTTTIPDLLTLKFGFTDDEDHAEITYPIESLGINVNVTDKEEYLGHLINRIVDEVAGDNKTPEDIRQHFYDHYQSVLETILYMANDLTENEKTKLLNALNGGLEKELDGKTLVALISSIVIVELLPEGIARDAARLVPKEILHELISKIFTDAKKTLDGEEKLCKYIDQINNSAEDMIDLIYNFVLNDLHDNLLTTIGTALYYGKSLVYAHYPQVAMAYLRAHDSDYIGGVIDPYDPGEHGSYSGSSSTGSGVSPGFTYGRWTLDANGKDWNFYVKDSSGNENKFCGGWIYAYNPAAKDYNHKADWFFFDKTGKMLTGWQKLFWNNVESWFYLNPKNDETGTFGACQLGGKTADGYTLNADGTWSGR